MNINWRNFTPIGDWLLVALEQEEEIEGQHGVVILKQKAPKNHFRLLRAPKGYEYDLESNDLLFCTKLNPARLREHCINDKEQVYVLPKSIAVGCYRDGGLKPLGKRLLIQRLISSELKLDSGIVIPAFTNSKDQTKEGVVLATGIPPITSPNWDPGVSGGEIVTLSKWDMSHTEISLPGGAYALIVDSKFVSCAETGRDSLFEYEHNLKLS